MVTVYGWGRLERLYGRVRTSGRPLWNEANLNMTSSELFGTLERQTCSCWGVRNHTLRLLPQSQYNGYPSCLPIRTSSCTKHISIHMCMYICIYIYIYTNLFTYTRVYVGMYPCMYVCMYVYMYVCMYIYIYIYIYIMILHTWSHTQPSLVVISEIGKIQ